MVGRREVGAQRHPPGPGAVGPSTYGDTVSVNVDYSGYMTSPMTGCGNNPSPNVSVSPATLNYGGQLVGTSSAAKTATVTNASNFNLQIGTLAVSGDYALSNDTCSGSTLDVWATCTFDVTFTATATGTRTGSVQIPSDAWNSPTAVSLKGTGLASLTAPMPKSPKDGSAAYKPPKLSWKGTVSGLSGPATAAHFHSGESGKNGGVVVPIAGADKGSFEGSATLTDEQAADLMAGKWYVNVHTAANKAGEVRGQVTK